MDVNIIQENRTERPRTWGIVRLVFGLYFLTYLTSNEKGLPSPEDVVRLSFHMLKRFAELIEMFAHFLNSVL